MRLAWRSVLRDRTRFALSVTGVALAMMLMLLLAGLEAGLYRQMAAYLERAPGSLVVAQLGVDESLGAASILPSGALEEVERTPGVARAVPVVSQFVILDLHEQKQPAYLVGYDVERGGGPWRMEAGREPLADDEAVLDGVLAARHEVGLDDTLQLMGSRFRIVGLSADSSSWMTSFLFIPASAAESLLGSPGLVSYVFVTPESGANEAALQERLGHSSGVEVTPKDDVIANDRQVLARIFSGPIRLMTGIAFVVGTLVVGLILYTATIERRREYGVLKALGAKSRMLYLMAVTQAAVVAIVGSLAGIVMALLAGELVMAIRPEFSVALEGRAAALVLGAGLAMALVGALLPARVIAGLAPADVFRTAR